MVELVLYALPALVYLLIQGTRTRLGRASALRRLGASWGRASDYLWAAALLLPLGGLGALAILAIPASALQGPGVATLSATTIGAALTVVARALGEEILFRGLIGGVLLRRLGFGLGNLTQAAIFLVPHLLLLLVDPAMWPALPVQFIAGWLLGWLRHRSGSFVPGALAHAAANLGAGLLTA